MPSILIQLDEPLLRSLNKIAPAAKRQRAEFIRQAVKEAIRKREYEAIREAYLRQPDCQTTPMTGPTPKGGSREAVRNLVGGPAQPCWAPSRSLAEPR